MNNYHDLAFKNKEEKMIFAKIINKAELCEKSRINMFTDFLDPEKTSKCFEIFKNNKNIDLMAYGGSDDAERSIIGFSKMGNELKTEDFNISAISISYNNKFVKKLSHRDFLGSILALGIKREVLGDILVYNDKAVVYVQEEIKDFIIYNLEKVKNATVKCSETNISEIPQIDDVQKRIIVASLRLDVIICDCFNISRKRANELIESEKVFINWSKTTNNSKQININDNITLRGMGRIKIIEIVGTTKKQRIILDILKKG